MEEKAKRKKRIFRNLKNKYRLVVMNDDTLEEKASLILSPLNVFVFVGSTALFLIVTVIYVIAFTPLREYIPGYADVNMRRNIVKLTLKADSLEQQLATRDNYIQNIKNIIEGNEPGEKVENNRDPNQNYKNLPVSPTAEEAALRQEVEQQDQFSLSLSDNKSEKSGVSSFFFFVPLQGTVTNSYNSDKSHFGVDIVAAKNEAIKATLDGTVILATWTSETGYVIQLQHSNNLVSVYKHNSVLLKIVGDRVKAGEPIAIIGDSGELTTGPHLHFELWYNGTPVNPQDYMKL